MPWYQSVSIVVATLVALVGLPAAVYTNYSVRLRHEHKVKRLLDLTDKLAPDAAGRKQIESALHSATVDLAFFLEFPRTLRDRVPVVAAIAAFSASAFGFTWSRWYGDSWVVWCTLIVQTVAGYVFVTAFRNSDETTALTRILFAHLNAPQGLIRDRPSIWRRARQPGPGDVLRFAATVRDRTTDRSMTTVEAVNSGAVEARREMKRLHSQARRLKAKMLWLAYVATPAVALRVLAQQLRSRSKVRRLLRRLAKQNPALAAELRTDYDRDIQPLIDSTITTLKDTARFSATRR